MPIGDPITPPLPVVGEAGTGYASKLLAFLEEVKTRLEAEVPVTALLEGTFDEANNPIVNLQYAGLYDQAGASTPPTGSLYRIGGNLWWVSASGAFQVTNGAALNATSVNGFTGDYGSPNPAEARFDDLDQRYSFYDDYASADWAYVRARGFDVAGGASSLNRCRIEFGGVADYTLTLPAAVPASQVLMQMTAGGAITLSNSLPVDTDIVLSGTGKVQHGEKRFFYPAQLNEGFKHAGVGLTLTGDRPGVNIDDTSSVSWLIPHVHEDWRIKKVQVLTDDHAGQTSIVALDAYNPSTNTWADYETSAGQATSTPFLTLATPYPCEDAFTFNYALGIRIDVRGSAVVGTFKVLGFYVTYDIPA